MRDVDEGYKNWDNNLSIRYLASPLSNTHLDIVVDHKFTFSIDSERFSNAEDENPIGNLLKHRSKGYGVLVNIRKLLDQKRRFKNIIDKMIHNFEIKNLYK